MKPLQDEAHDLLGDPTIYDPGRFGIAVSHAHAFDVVVALLKRARRAEAAHDLAVSALEDLLMHSGIADAAPEDKDLIDNDYERKARAIISTALSQESPKT